MALPDQTPSLQVSVSEIQMPSAGTVASRYPVALPPWGITPKGVSQLAFAVVSGVSVGTASIAVGAGPS